MVVLAESMAESVRRPDVWATSGSWYTLARLLALALWLTVTIVRPIGSASQMQQEQLDKRK